MVKVYKVLAFAGLLFSDGLSALHVQKKLKTSSPFAGYEDMKRWKEQ